DFSRNRTDPSAKAALKPSGVYPPSSGKGPFGSKGMSSGLVQGMSRWASTTRIVFEVPSVICTTLGTTGPGSTFWREGAVIPFLTPIPPAASPPGIVLNAVDGPVKTKYELWLRLDGVPSGPG